MKKINRVLLVDDDNSANFYNKSIIENFQFANEIITKTNGKEAFSYLEKECRHSDSFPDLILLDLKMPVMDGIQFIQRFELLCKNIKFNIVLVILTGSQEPEDYMKLIEMGHYYVINKPLTADKLMDIHHRFFRHYKLIR